MAKKNKTTSRAGVPVDAYGGGTIDPTANVIALVKAEASAAKALRKADTKFNDAVARHIQEMANLRAANAETLRVSDLDRLDKTRQVDVLAATASAASLATAVQTLANTSDRNAETLRNLVNATAQTMAKQTSDQAQVLSAQTDSLVKGINAQIAELQKAQYQGVGKSSVVDPLQAETVAEMKAIRVALAGSGGQSQGATKMWGYVVVAVGLLFTAGSFLLGIAGLAITILIFMMRR